MRARKRGYGVRFCSGYWIVTGRRSIWRRVTPKPRAMALISDITLIKNGTRIFADAADCNGLSETLNSESSYPCKSAQSASPAFYYLSVYVLSGIPVFSSLCLLQQGNRQGVFVVLGIQAGRISGRSLKSRICATLRSEEHTSEL